MTNSLQAWRLVNDISDKLCRRMHNETILELMFWTAIENKTDPSLILQTLYENITDNETAVANIIGDHLTNKIKSYVLQSTDTILHGVPVSALQNEAGQCQEC